MSNKYEQPANVLSRLRYYDGEFLKDEDLIAEQQFHIDRKWRHDRLLHAPGIAEGLDVSLAKDTAGTVRLRVSAGTAVDSQGRTILLAEERLIDIDPAWAGERWVAIRFNEQEDRLVPDDSATGGVKGATRFTQIPLIDVVADLDALRAQGLAPVPLDLLRFAAGEQPMFRHLRTYAGLRLPGEGTGSTLQVRVVPGPPGRPLALAYLDTPLEMSGPLRVTNNSGALRFEARTDGSLQVGSITIMGTDKPEVNSWAGIQFPRDPGGGSGDTAFIRYYVAESETCRLQVGIENDAQDTVALWQMGAERLTIFNGNVGIGVEEAKEKLEVAGNVLIKGGRLKNASGLSILETNAEVDDWLRINPDRHYPKTAIYSAVAISYGGLAVGEWTQQPNGRLVVTENALIDGDVGIGTRTPGAKLEVVGDVKFGGSRLRNSSGFSIFETNANDWLRINPDSQYPGIALYAPVAIGTGGLAVGEWSQQPQGRLVVTENAFVIGCVGIGTTRPEARLEVAGDVKISGSRLRNASGFSIVETNVNDWLRINPDSSYPSIALFTPVAIGTGGLAVGEWSAQPAGQLLVKGGSVLMGSVGIGTATPGAMLEVAGDVKISGARLRDAYGNAIVATDNAEQRLRINPDRNYTEIDLGDVKLSMGRLRNGYGTAMLDTSHNHYLRFNPDGQYRKSDFIGDVDVDGTLLYRGTPIENLYSPVNHDHAWILSQNGRFRLIMGNNGHLLLYDGNTVVWSANTGGSDASLKRDVEPISGAMDKLRQVRGVSFFWRNEQRGTRRELGVLAQEVQPVLPELVDTLDGQHLGVRYDRFVPVLIQALKEQDERIARLEARLRDLGALASEPAPVHRAS